MQTEESDVMVYVVLYAEGHKRCIQVSTFITKIIFIIHFSMNFVWMFNESSLLTVIAHMQFSCSLLGVGNEG